ncbi:hypothetical protein RFI_36653, partial [Reticulomyxa filosa]
MKKKKSNCHEMQRNYKGQYLKIFKNSGNTNQNDSQSENNRERADNENDDEGKNESQESASDQYVEVPTLPCYLSRFDAVESFVEWVKAQSLAPQDVKNNPLDYIHAVGRYYVPYWHFEVSARSGYHASTYGCVIKKIIAHFFFNTNTINQLNKQANKKKRRMKRAHVYILPIYPKCKLWQTHYCPKKKKNFYRSPWAKHNVLPTVISKEQATNKIIGQLKELEHKRMIQFISGQKLHNVKFETEFDYSSRLAYMPCFIIYYSPTEKALHTNDLEIPSEPERNGVGLERVIINGSCGFFPPTFVVVVVGCCFSGSVAGKRLYSFPKIATIGSGLVAAIGFPLCKALLLPIEICVATVMGGSIITTAMASSKMSSSSFMLHGERQNTHQAQYRRKAMEDKNIEEM